MQLLESPAPDLIEPVEGFRGWELARDEKGSLVLASVVREATWPPLREARAACEISDRRGHRSPDPACTCGLYAVERAGRLAEVVSSNASVIGSVSLWGRVAEHRHGYRAEFGYPERLRLVCGRCVRLRRRGTPVRVMQTDDGGLVAVCDRHRVDVPASRSEPARAVQAELLSTYAVDLLAGETIERAIAPSRPRRIAWLVGKTFRMQWGVVAVMALYLALQFTVAASTPERDHLGPFAISSAPSVVASATPTAQLTSQPQVTIADPRAARPPEAAGRGPRGRPPRVTSRRSSPLRGDGRRRVNLGRAAS